MSAVIVDFQSFKKKGVIGVISDSQSLKQKKEQGKESYPEPWYDQMTEDDRNMETLWHANSFNWHIHLHPLLKDFLRSYVKPEFLDEIIVYLKSCKDDSFLDDLDTLDIAQEDIQFMNQLYVYFYIYAYTAADRDALKQKLDVIKPQNKLWLRFHWIIWAYDIYLAKKAAELADRSC